MSDELREDAFLEDSMERYGDAVYRLALCRLGSRADAEDVYQDFFSASAARHDGISRR